MDWINKIHVGDVVEILQKMPSDFVDMVITSPPYWSLRDYGKQNEKIWGGDKDCEHDWDSKDWGTPNKNVPSIMPTTVEHQKVGEQEQSFCKKCNAWQGQLGMEPHPQMFIDNLVSIFDEVKRVLKPAGSFYLNLGDSYYSQPPGGSVDAMLESKKISKRTSMAQIAGQKNKQFKPDGKWLQAKQLMLMPSRVAITMQNDGWIIRNDIIWEKVNAMPTSVRDRLNTTYEHLFHFVKRGRYYYDLDAIRVPHKTAPGKSKKPIKTKYAMLESIDNSEEIQRHIMNVYQIAKKTERITYDGSKTLDEGAEGINAKGLTSCLATVRKVAKDYIKEHKLSGSVAGAVYEYAHNSSGNPLGRNPGDFIGTKHQVGDGYRQGMNRDEESFSVQLENPPEPSILVEYLQGYRMNNPLSYKQIDDKFGKSGDTASHWFTMPEKSHGFAYPSPEDWMKLKRLFAFDESFDKQMTETVMVSQAISDNPLGKNRGDFFAITKHKNDRLYHGEGGFYHPYGKNRGDVFQIPTKPSALYHFAIFPPDLVEVPIKATCPKEVCVKCGAPKERITVVDGKSSYELSKDQDKSRFASEQGQKQNMRADREAYYRPRYTLGWKPTCKCGVEFEPGIVMDIFSGSGTSCLLAKQLGRNYIGIEMNPEYAEMSRKRISKSSSIYKWKGEEMDIGEFEL